MFHRTAMYYNNKVKMADVIGFYLCFPSFTHASLCSLNTLIHRRIWTSYKFRKMDGLGRENGCHATTSISPGERTERVETPRNWTKSASDHDGQSTAHKPQYAPSRCAKSQAYNEVPLFTTSSFAAQIIIFILCSSCPCVLSPPTSKLKTVRR